MAKKTIYPGTQGRKNKVLERHVDLTGIKKYQPWTKVRLTLKPLFRWSYVQSMNVTRSRVALVADMDRLWAIGGYDGMKNLSTVWFIGAVSSL